MTCLCRACPAAAPSLTQLTVRPDRSGNVTAQHGTPLGELVADDVGVHAQGDRGAAVAEPGGDDMHGTPDAQSCSYELHRRWHHARRMRLPHVLVGFTRMKCAGTPSIHGSSPAPMTGARSASVSR